MQESDASAVCSDARFFAHQLVPLISAAPQGGIQIGHAEADVVDSRSAFGDEFGDRPVVRLRFEKFDIDVAERQRYNGGAICRLERFRNGTEYLLVERRRRGKVRNRDADVSDRRAVGRH